MTQNTNNNESLKAVLNTIENYSKKNITYEQALRQYKDHLITNSDHCPENSAPHSQLRSILFNHTWYNFCKLSCLIQLQSEFTVIDSAGDISFLSHIQSITEKSDMFLTDDTAPYHSKDFDSITLYYAQVDRKSRKYFIAFTSSKLFSHESFTAAADILKKLDSYSSILLHYNTFDFFSIQMQALKEYLHTVKPENTYCHIYIFDSIHEIYGHMGIFTIHTISALIREKLHSEYRASEGTVFSISINNYLVLSSLSSNPRLSFSHKDISLPYSYTSIPVNRTTVPYTIIEAFTSFSKSKTARRR